MCSRSAGFRLKPVIFSREKREKWNFQGKNKQIDGFECTEQIYLPLPQTSQINSAFRKWHTLLWVCSSYGAANVDVQLSISHANGLSPTKCYLEWEKQKRFAKMVKMVTLTFVCVDMILQFIVVITLPANVTSESSVETRFRKFVGVFSLHNLPRRFR